VSRRSACRNVGRTRGISRWRGGTFGAAAAHPLAGAVTAAVKTKGIRSRRAASSQSGGGRPLELIDGPAPLMLLSERSGIEARIES
jgi:hypothetical protein